MSASQWIGTVRALGGEQVVNALGLSWRARAFGPCPACGATQRASADKRGPCGLTSNALGWRCHACNEHGDLLDLVSWVDFKRSTRGSDGEQWHDLHRACVKRGLCGDESRAPTSSVADVVASYMGDRPTPPLTPQDDAGVPRRRGPASATPGPVAPSQGASQRKPGRRAPVFAGSESSEPVAATPSTGKPGVPECRTRFTWSETLTSECEAALHTPEGEHVLAYLRSRKLTDEAIAEFRIGAYIVRDEHERTVERWVAIPLLNGREDVVNVRFRSVPGTCLHCSGAGCWACLDERPGKESRGKVPKHYRPCPGRPLVLYGCQKLGNDLTARVVVVEGELDVVAAWSYGMTSNVVSGTAGAGTFASKSEWLDQLEHYAGFVLALDQDAAGDKGAAAIAARLGRERCARARLPSKDLGQCLIDGVPLARVTAVLDRAEPMIEVKVQRADHYVNDIEALINNPTSLAGRPTGSSRFDACIGGLTPGCYVFSGKSGHGKTTLATWLCYEQARAGVPTLITSFEQRPIGTVMKLLRARIGGDFRNFTVEQRAEALYALGELPLHIVDHRGNLAPDKVFETLRYARRRLDCRVMLIDHLGFCLNPKAEDERRDIEAFIRALSMWAENNEVTVLLIAHPGKIVDQRRPTMDDLKGASAIQQDSHGVVIVERGVPSKKNPTPSTNVYVDKWRSEFGKPGSMCSLAFDPWACVYADEWASTPACRAGVQIVGVAGGAADDDKMNDFEPGAPRKPRRRGPPKAATA